MEISNHQAIDINATDLNEQVEIEVCERGINPKRLVVYVHVNGITLCRAICHTLRTTVPTGLTVRRTKR
ncbi:MAG TPA: hypothetical protein VF077_08945 [Nitrospiraceae bacterium]